MATEPTIIDESEPTLTPEEVREHNFAEARAAAEANHAVDMAGRPTTEAVAEAPADEASESTGEGETTDESGEQGTEEV